MAGFSGQQCIILLEVSTLEYIQSSWHSTDVDVTSPDEKSIMTYVAQFLQYFKSLPVAEDRMQVQYVIVKCF